MKCSFFAPGLMQIECLRKNLCHVLQLVPISILLSQRHTFVLRDRYYQTTNRQVLPMHKKDSFLEIIYCTRNLGGYIMSNQILLWSMLILPWLTLFFMPKENIKMWMPVALFSALTSVLAVELGENLGWFIYGEATSPLRTPSHIIFGLNIITTMWLFYFLYGKFWRYIVIDTILNFGFIYLFHVYFLGSRGLFHEVGITPLLNALIVTFDGALAYGYQIWQEEVFVRSESKSASYSSNLQPAAAKPLPKDQDHERSE
jgi:hypothetical protein